jgi:hypothetical protein
MASYDKLEKNGSVRIGAALPRYTCRPPLFSWPFVSPALLFSSGANLLFNITLRFLPAL